MGRGIENSSRSKGLRADIWSSRFDAAKRVGGPICNAHVEFADGEFERTLEFNQHDTVPFGVSKVINENAPKPCTVSRNRNNLRPM